MKPVQLEFSLDGGAVRAPQCGDGACSFGIGDDIVDLRITKPAPHPRFVDRVFTERERSRIGGSWKLMWLHWAAKEAAFKAFSRFIPALKFVPRRFVVDLTNRKVFSELGAGYFQAFVSDELVYVRLVTSESNCLMSLSSWIGAHKAELSHSVINQHSVLVRRMAQRRISEILSVAPESIEIGSQDHSRWTRIPVLKLRGERHDSQLSFSHHGRFCSFSFYSPMCLAN